MNRKLSITRQSSELNVLYRPRMKGRMFCVGCDRDVRWVTPDEAMALRGTSLRDIFRMIEADRLHYAETKDGFLLVCAESLDQEIKISGEKNDEIDVHLIAS